MRIRSKETQAFIFAAVVALEGCALFGAVRTVAPVELVPLQTTSSFHPLFYVASAQHYHYFEHLELKYDRSYRVDRASLTLANEFARGERKSQVMGPGTIEAALAAPQAPDSTQRDEMSGVEKETRARSASAQSHRAAVVSRRSQR